MKRICGFIVTALCLAVLCSCGGTHTHEFEKEFSHDDTHHWYACTGEKCDEVDGKAEHTLADPEITDGGVKYTCSVCGAEVVDSTPDTEVSEAEWKDALNFIEIDSFTYVASEVSLDGDFDTITLTGKFDANAIELSYVERGELARYYYMLRRADDVETDDALKYIFDNVANDFATFTYDAATGYYTRFVEDEGATLKCKFVNGVLYEFSYTDDIEEMTIVFSDYGKTVTEMPEEVGEWLADATKSSKFNNVTIKGNLYSEMLDLRLDKDPNNEKLAEILTEIRRIKAEDVVEYSAFGESVWITSKDKNGDDYMHIIEGGRLTQYILNGHIYLEFTDYGTTVGYGSSVGKLCQPTSVDLIGGGQINTADLEGQIVVINFWGTWCNPCKQELPDFSSIASDYSDSVKVIAIHSTEGLGNAASYVSTNFSGSKMIFGYDQPGEAYFDKLYGQFDFNGSYPATVILDENGVIIYKHVGVISYAELKGIIDGALGE